MIFIASKLYAGSKGNLISFKIFGTLFPKSTIVALHATKNDSVILKTY